MSRFNRLNGEWRRGSQKVATGISGPGDSALRAGLRKANRQARVTFPFGCKDSMWHSRRGGKCVAFTVGVLAIGSAWSKGQDIFAPLTRPYDEQAASKFFQTNGLPAEAASGLVAPDREAGNPLRFGPFSLHPRVDYQFLNGSGVLVGQTNIVRVNAGVTNVVTKAIVASTIQHTLSPGLQVAIGKYWSLDVAAGFNFYSDRQFNDYVGYQASLSGSIPREEWIFGVSAGLGSSESSQIQTGGQTKQETYNTALSAVYGSKKRLSLELGAAQNIQLSEGFNDTIGWSTLNWLNYVATLKTSVALGVGGGYNSVDAGPRSLSAGGTDSAYEQVQGRLIWNPFAKLGLQASGGAQIQQFLGDEPATVVNPIFSLSVVYSPLDGTSLSLTGSRTVGNSIVSDEFTETTAFSFSVNQRLFKRLNLSIGPSYNMTDYHSSSGVADSADDRRDDYWAVQVRLSTALLKKISLAAFVQFSENSSTQDGFTYESRQFGLQAGYRF